MQRAKQITSMFLLSETRGYDVDNIPTWDTPQKMVHLFLNLPIQTELSLIDLRKLLHVHGLDRYQENLTNNVQEFQSKREFEFVFPRYRLEDVRYFSHILGSILSDNFPDFVPHQIERWDGLSGIFGIGLSNHRSRPISNRGPFSRRGFSHSSFLVDINQQRRFFRNIHKKDREILDMW